MEKVIRKISILFFIFICFNLVFAQILYLDTNYADTNSGGFLPSIEANTALQQINLVRSQIREMGELGFEVTRVSDEFFVSTQVYENNISKEKENIFVDYSRFFEQIKTVKKTISLAYQVNDELIALNYEIENLRLSLDVSEVDVIFAEANQEFKDQRYELVPKLVDSAYTKINELQSIEAKTNAAYDAASKSIEFFIKENLESIITTIISIIILFLIFRRKLKRMLIKRRISLNEYEEEVLKTEIKNTQRRYFVEGDVAESEYNIKIKVYSDKVRELNRETALLIELLEKTKKHGKFKKTQGNQEHKEIIKQNKKFDKKQLQIEKNEKKVKNKESARLKRENRRKIRRGDKSELDLEEERILQEPTPVIIHKEKSLVVGKKSVLDLEEEKILREPKTIINKKKKSVKVRAKKKKRKKRKQKTNKKKKK